MKLKQEQSIQNKSFIQTEYFAFGVISASILVNSLLIGNNLSGNSGYHYPVSKVYLFSILLSMINCIAAGMLLKNKEINKKIALMTAALTVIPSMIPVCLLIPVEQLTLGIISILGIVVIEIFIVFKFLSRIRTQNSLLSFPSENKVSALSDNELNSKLENGLNQLKLNEEYHDSMTDESEEEIQHQMTRSKLEDGTETMSGMIRMVIPTKIKTETIHLSFCPAFNNVPQIECEIISDAPVRVRVAEIRNYGTRLELRRSERLDQECPIEVEYFIQNVVEEKSVIQNKNVA